RVISTASASKHAYMKSLGADELIDYTQNDFVQAIRAKYSQGIDDVFDTVGREVQKKSADVLKKGGRLTSILALDEAYFRKKEVISGYVFVHPDAQQLNHLKEFAEAGKLKVHLAARFPLAEAAKAHEMLESGHVQGKIVLEIPA